jgi:hypothetical protein
VSRKGKSMQPTREGTVDNESAVLCQGGSVERKSTEKSQSTDKRIWETTTNLTILEERTRRILLLCVPPSSLGGTNECNATLIIHCNSSPLTLLFQSKRTMISLFVCRCDAKIRCDRKNGVCASAVARGFKLKKR